MKQLVIAEKPSVASDLARVLGANEKKKTYYEGKHAIVTWAYGHLLTLKMPEDYNKEWRAWNMEQLPMLPKHFLIKPLPKTKGQLQAIRQLSERRDVKEVVIATDAGREGELVARWILQYIGYKGKVKRLWISSQTDKAIKEGFQHLKDASAYQSLFAAAKARAEADWLIGINVSRALSVKYHDQLSAGRVQTPTLVMVREREKEIESFKPKEQFVVTMTTQQHDVIAGRPLIFNSQSQAQEVVNDLQKHPATVEKIVTKTKRTPAPLLYDLTELQQVANKRYGFSAKQTLNIVQRLYEHHKIVSYPRTDSKYLPSDIEKTMKERIQAISKAMDVTLSELNQAKVKQRRIFNDQKVSDHYGLIPTEHYPQVEKLTRDEWRIYQLINQRFIGLFKDHYEVEVMTATLRVGKQRFILKQEKVLCPGWKTELSQQESWLSVKEGEMVELHYHIQRRMTTPKARLTESDLLARMEKHHLGTPATRAEIIEKLLASQYMERQQREFIVTPKGKQLLNLVNPSLVTPDLTETWELHLQRIEKGKETQGAFIKQMKHEATRLVDEIRHSDKQYKDFALTTKKCPECGERLREKKTKNGVYYVCSNPECHYKRRRDPKVSNHRCSQCHKKMVIIEGKNGAYFKCQQCSITEKIPDKKERRQKMTKAEERRLMKKYSEKEQLESPLAAALKDLNL